MSASESTSSGTNLHESIEQLIAETVRRSQVDHENEKQQLQAALQQALTEVEAGQAAMNKAAGILRSALDAPVPTAEQTTPVEPREPALPVAIEKPEAEDLAEVPPVVEPDLGPHELDVVAHDATIDTAKRLQAMLRDRDEVTDMKPRSFVNGELHLRLEMASGLEMASIKEWIAEHKGRVATSTSSVLELRFGS